LSFFGQFAGNLSPKLTILEEQSPFLGSTTLVGNAYARQEAEMIQKNQFNDKCPTRLRGFIFPDECAA